jgi:hypothetical protein
MILSCAPRTSRQRSQGRVRLTHQGDIVETGNESWRARFCHSENPVAGTRQRRLWNASRNIGGLWTVSMRALMCGIFGFSFILVRHCPPKGIVCQPKMMLPH